MAAMNCGRALLIVCLLTLISCASKTTSELLEKDSPRATSSATFTAPAEWTITTKGPLTVLTAPEKDSRIALVDLKAADSKAAVAAAWAAYRPESKRPIKLITANPPREGWDQHETFAYETSPNERAEVQAEAQRAGDTWTVAIIDGTEPTFEKRLAQVALTLGSLRPKGYQRESFAGRKAHPLDDARVKALLSFTEDSMKKLNVPGVGVGLIDGGRIVYEGGLGVKKLGESAPVDANTLFMAASNTKQMTTMLLAMLADEQKLRWDQPVIELYPAFKLGSPETTRQVLVKHLVCACTGMPRQDLEWLLEYKNATPESSMALLGTMQPTSKFGEVFQYSNLMAAAAGYVAAHVYDPSHELGVAYDHMIQKLVFDPIGMKSTTFDNRRAWSGNHAFPHADDVDGKPSIADMGLNYSVTALRPAGGVWTSAHDLIRYVQLEIGRGVLPDGKRLVSEENLLMRRQPQVRIGEDAAYGMGLEVDKTWGVEVVHHGGSLAGYKSDLMFLPDYGVGAVILTNADNGGMLLDTFQRRLLEILFDGKPEAAGNLDSAVANYRADRAKQRERLTIPAAPDQVAKLAPHYHNAALGEIDVIRQRGSTTFDFPEYKSAVASRHNDDGTTSFITITPGLDGFEFVVGDRAGKPILTIRDAQHEYVFE
jgi:CubicO group peptidase (beta-lactamase class C family)